MIKVSHLYKQFGNKEVLKDISFTFDTGKTNLVIGKSGSGKTVLIKCLVGLFEIDSGSISYDDRILSEMDVEQRKKLRQEIGMVFQGGALFDSMTVEDNLMFPLNMFSQMSEEEKLERVNFCLKRVNLENVNKLFPSEISGGMKKRVAIARAIVLNPKYLFFDEPNSGLDPQTSILIDNLIQEITHEYNITTIINTHDMNSVFEIGENIILIDKGEKAWEGNSNTIINSNNDKVNSFVFASNFHKTMRQKSNQRETG